MTMGWAEVIKLIIEVGLPAAEMLIKKWTDGVPPTPEAVAAAIAEAKQLGQKTPESILLGILASKGISSTDQRAQDMLRLIGA